MFGPVADDQRLARLRASKVGERHLLSLVNASFSLYNYTDATTSSRARLS